MSTPTSAAPTLDDWLLAMISADVDELRMITIRGMSGNLNARIRCERHAQTFTWSNLWRHLTATETEHQAAHPEDGPNAAAHSPGDLYEEGDLERAPRWPASACRTCHSSIVWAQTTGGKRMPVDAAPSAGGTVVLAEQGPGLPPLAMVLHTEAERDTAPAASLHTAHFATCPQANKHRRRR